MRQSVQNTATEDHTGRTDYPLIDISFNDGNDWMVVISNNVYTENPTYRVCKNGKEIQFNKEFLSVVTYPEGRGTTGNGCIDVYKNGQIHRMLISSINTVKEKSKQ